MSGAPVVTPRDQYNEALLAKMRELDVRMAPDSAPA